MPLTKFYRDIPETVLPAAGGHLTGPQFAALWAAFGAQMDAGAEQTFAGRLQANPWAGGLDPQRTGAARASDGRLLECEPFVLPILAAQRGLRLYSSSATLANRYRLARWLQIRASFGTDEGKLRNLQSLFVGIPDGVGGFLPLPTLRLFFQSNEGTPTSTCHTLDPEGLHTVVKADPSTWNFDNQPAKCSRFWVVVYLPVGYGGAWQWDGGDNWDAGQLWDAVTAAAIADWVAALKEAKGAGSRLAGLFVTALQPSDDIPGYPGRHIFDPTDTAIQDPLGWTSLPIGNWGTPVYTSGPYFGHDTMIPYAALVYSDNP